MTTAERVGQLFLVTFQGNSLDPEGEVIQLITQHHISGVLISEENDNVVGGPQSTESLRQLIRDLQGVNFNSDYLTLEGDTITNPPSASYVPLYVAMKYEGGQHGNLRIQEGLSAIASNMAIGATWDEELARQTGEVIGRELEALGINMLLGPPLDVMEDPQAAGLGGLSVEPFGGDPYWVSVMGSAFISGIHTGAGDRLAIVASHFPGLGSSDRPIEDEVATVRKSLEELKQFDLAPFFAVTRIDQDTGGSLIDGLLTSHIRYQGLQGNIRATTRPISLDPQAFELVMSLEPLAEWRAAGGLTVSDSLGSRAIRFFRDPTGLTFNAHLVARDAFLAGNDLLLLEDFRDSDDPEEFTTITATLAFFENKYNEDPLFAELVDEAVLRIIRSKLNLYGNRFTTSQVLEPQNDIDDLGSNQQLVSRIAQAAATLITPSQTELEVQVGGIPRIGERVVFLTDVRYITQCSNCEAIPLMPSGELERAVLRLFGPSAAGQVGGWNLRSYTFADLANYLGERASETLLVPLASEDELDEAIRNADWLVFSQMDSRSSDYGANALHIFLDKRPDLARDKRVVVFSHDVPFGLDATDISKVDVFYALYDSGQAFVEMAAKLLFQEQAAIGASPVSIPGIGYDLIEVTAPDPLQVISIELVLESLEGETSEEPEGFRIGDEITVQTGIILDGNAHRVPDNTPVEFLIETPLDGGTATILDSATLSGQASVTLRIDQAGLLTVSVRSVNARVSERLQIDAQEDVAAQAIVISPTLIPTVTSEPTTTPLVPTNTPDVQSEDQGAIEGTFSSRLGALVLGLVSIAISSSLGYFSANRLHASEYVRLRFAILPALAGLIAYNYLALGLPGSPGLTTVLGGLGVFAVVTVGGGIGLLVAYLWERALTP